MTHVEKEKDRRDCHASLFGYTRFKWRNIIRYCSQVLQ